MKELSRLIGRWFDDRGITKGSTAKDQLEKAESEFNELKRGVLSDDLHEVKDGIGDVYVTLIGIAKQYGWTIEECVEYAFKEIEHRKGFMVRGKYVKESSLKLRVGQKVKREHFNSDLIENGIVIDNPRNNDWILVSYLEPIERKEETPVETLSLGWA